MFTCVKILISHVRFFMIITHVQIIAFRTITNHSFWTLYIGGKPVVYITREISCSTLEINLVFPQPMYYSLYIFVIDLTTCAVCVRLHVYLFAVALILLHFSFLCIIFCSYFACKCSIFYYKCYQC